MSLTNKLYLLIFFSGDDAISDSMYPISIRRMGNITEERDVWVFGSKGVELTCRANVDDATVNWLTWSKADTASNWQWHPVRNGSENLVFIYSNERDSSTLKFLRFWNATERISKALSAQYMCVVRFKKNATVSLSDQITIRYPCKYSLLLVNQ